jgi:hypothetical protein
MKRLALLGAVATLVAVAVPGVASAGQLSGVVVAKDAARRSVAVATRGDVRTVRTARFGALKLGQRVAATGVTLGDGTFSARTVRASGRAKQVRFRAVVVRNEAANHRLIVSAGGTVFAFRFSATILFASDGSGLAPGDQVTVSADVKKDQLQAEGQDVKETGHVEALKLEGIFLRGGQDGFDIAVVHRGLVRVHFTKDAQLPDWQPGDVVYVLVSVAADGSFNFVNGRTDGKPGSGDSGSGDHSGEAGKTGSTTPTLVDASGVLSARSATQVTVTRADGTSLTCTVPATIDVSGFAVGAKVGMYCKKTDGGLIVQGIKALTVDPPGPTSFAGAISAISDSVTVHGDDGKEGSCAVPAGLDLSLFHVGDKVKLACVLRNGHLVVSSLRSDRAFINVDTHEVGLIGFLGERSTTGVTVNADGATLHCGLATPVDLSMFSVGDKVSLSCKRGDAGLTFALLYGSGGSVKADGTAERTVYGTLAARGEDSVTVTLESGTLVTCVAPATVDLSAFHVGDKVKMRCRTKDGQWRLSLLGSATATVEVTL